MFIFGFPPDMVKLNIRDLIILFQMKSHFSPGPILICLLQGPFNRFMWNVFR